MQTIPWKTLSNLLKSSLSCRRSRTRRFAPADALEARCLLSGTGYFIGGQRLGDSESFGVDLGDLDGDGDLDAFLANAVEGGTETGLDWAPNSIWLNDGNGNFTDSGQLLGNEASLHVALGDLNGDGALDAFVGNVGGNSVWLNNGSGIFSNSGQSLGSGDSLHVALADLDGDGDLDAAVANSLVGRGVNTAGAVWINDGAGVFTSSGSAVWEHAVGVAVGDVDGDGDADTFVTRQIETDDGEAAPDQLWLNSGNGTFTQSNQQFATQETLGVALADFDNDGDLDAFAAGQDFSGPSRFYINQGGTQNGVEGTFVDSGDDIGLGYTNRVAVADLNGDSFLDVFLTLSEDDFDTTAGPVLLNSSVNGGSGRTLAATGQYRPPQDSTDVALGDLNGDGAIDALIGNGNGNGDPGARVWLNQSGPVITYPVDGNVPIDVPASEGLLADFEGTTISSVDTTGLAGAVNVNQSTGAFSFTPSIGFSGSDTFTIELSDSQTYIVAMDVSPAVPPTLIDVTNFTRLGPFSLASLAELEAVEITGPGHIVEFTVPIDSVATVYAVPAKRGAELTITVPEFDLSVTSSDSLGDAAILPPTILPTPEFEQQHEDADHPRIYTFRVAADQATSFDIGFYQNTAIEYVDQNAPVILDVNYVSEITSYTQGPHHSANGGSATMQCDLNAGKEVGDVETGSLQLQRFGTVVLTEDEDGRVYFYEYDPSTLTISGFFGFGDETHDGFFTGSSTDEENYAWDAASSTFVGTFVERGFLSWIIDDRESNCVTEYAVTLTPSGTQEQTDAFLDDTLNDSVALDIDFEWEISAYTQGPFHSANGGTAGMQCDLDVGKEVGDIETDSYRLHRYGNVVIAEFEDGQAAFYEFDPSTSTISGFFEFFEVDPTGMPDDIFTGSETDDESYTWDPNSSTFVGTYLGLQYLSWDIDDRESNCVTEYDATLTPTGTQSEIDAFFAEGHEQLVEPFFRHTDGNPGAYVVAGMSDIASGPDVDDYVIELINGQVVDVLLGSDHEAGRFRNETLELLSPTGTVVATGRPDLIAAEVNSTNVDLGILGFDVPASGQYTLRLTSSTAGNYQVAAITERTFNVEPDEGATGLQRNIKDSGHNIGFLDAAGDPHDFVEVDLIGGESYQFRTWTQFGSLDSPDKLPLNELDPEIRILAADGTELAHDQNSGCYNNGQLTFTPPGGGTYTVQISAESSFGEYSVSYRSAAVASFERLEPLGSLLAVSSTDVGNLCTGEVTELTVELDGDQAISGFLDGTDLSTEFSIEIVGIMDEFASENGDNFFKFGPHQIPEAGTYTVRIHNTGHPTNVSLGLVLNAAVDFNATDDNSPIPTDGSLISGADGGRWAAVSNAKRADDGSTNTDTDDFTIDLTGYAGETIDVLLTGIDEQAFDGATLQLLNPAGTVIATGTTTPLPNNATATNIDQGIFDFEVPADGVYTFRVTETVKIAGEPDVMYSLIVTHDTTFDAEPNNDLSAASLRNITTTKGAIGHVDVSGDVHDVFLIDLTAGETVTFSTKAPFDPNLSPVNALNPELELFDANGTSLASDLDSGDGIHSSLTFTPTADGTYSVRIAATEGAGEYLLAAEFEAATTEMLTLTLSDQEFSENGGQSTATVTRSGDTSSALDVTVASSDATEAVVPTTVIIPAGASSVQFAIDAVDDSDVDGTQTVSVNVSASDFTAASAMIDVTDDDMATGVIHFSDIPVGQKGSDFLSQYGISSVSVNAGEPLEVFAEQGPDQTHQLNPGSGNYLGQRNPAPFSARTMTFEFDGGLKRFAFRRIGGSNSSSAPFWSATAFNANNEEIDTTGESGSGFFLLRDDGYFELEASGSQSIARIEFDMASQLSTFGVVPIDDIELEFRNVIDFEDITVGEKGTDFLSSYGIASVTVDAGRPLEVFTEQGPGSNDELNPGSGNYLGQRNPAPFSARTMTFEFDDGLKRFAFRRIGGSNASSAPFWTATAFNADNESIGSARESGSGFFLLRSDQQFEIEAPEGEAIARIEFDMGSQLSTFGVVPIDDIELEFRDVPVVLGFTLDVAEIGENVGSATATVTRSGATADDLVVTLTSNYTDEATVPTSVTIAAGETSATFVVSAVDDNVANGNATVTISAAADGYETVESTILIEDDDSPELTVSIAADSIIENAGTDVASATVARNTPTDQPLTVSLSSSDTSEATVPTTVTIPAGASSVQFAIDAVDDSDVDGDQTVTFEASATGFATGTATLDVIDNDSAGDPIVLLPSGPVSSLRPEIVWTQVAGAVSYEVWMERIGGDANPILNPTVETTSLVPNVDLGIGSFRAWVRANFTDGSRSVWDASSFRIDAAAVIDDLPFHGADRTPTITWPAQAGADGYRVYIANVTANSVVLDETVTTNSFTPGTDFEFGKHRIWVRGISDGGFQARWSRSIDYYVGPSQIDAVRSTTDTTPTFQWESLANVASMQLYVSQGSNVILNQSGLSDAATITTELDEGFYRWWIRPTHTNGRLGEWSPMGRLEIGDRPIVIAPEFNTDDSTVQVAWGDVAGAGSYEIYLFNDDTSSLVHRATGITGTTYDYYPLPDGNYRVWIRSYTAEGAPDKWSRPHQFVIDTATSNTTVTLTSPLGSTFDESLTFEWTGDNEAASYDFYASDGDIFIEDFDLTETTYQSLFPLTTGPITWWVRAKTAAGEAGPWTRGDADISARPQIVALPGPVTEARPTIQWQSVDGAERYAVYIAGPNDSVIRDDNITSTEFVPTVDLTTGEHRLWIQAINASGLRGPWSAVYVMDVQVSDRESSEDARDASEALVESDSDSFVDRLERSRNDVHDQPVDSTSKHVLHQTSLRQGVVKTQETSDRADLVFAETWLQDFLTLRTVQDG